MKKNRYPKILPLLISLSKIAFIIAIFAYLIRNDKLDFTAIRVFFSRPYYPLLIVVFLLISLPFLATLRWWLFLQVSGSKITFRKSFALTWIGAFFNMIPPFGYALAERGDGNIHHVKPTWLRKGIEIPTCLVGQALTISALTNGDGSKPGLDDNLDPVDPNPGGFEPPISHQLP